MNFNEIIGNNDVKNMLNKSLNNETVLHSYMFIGEQGIGKKIVATAFSKKILC